MIRFKATETGLGKIFPTVVAPILIAIEILPILLHHVVDVMVLLDFVMVDIDGGCQWYLFRAERNS